jgi:hypothetical protein
MRLPFARVNTKVEGPVTFGTPKKLQFHFGLRIVLGTIVLGTEGLCVLV